MCVCVCVCVLRLYRTISIWDGKDGACLKYVNIPGNHSGIKVCLCHVFNQPYTLSSIQCTMYMQFCNDFTVHVYTCTYTVLSYHSLKPPFYSTLRYNSPITACLSCHTLILTCTHFPILPCSIPPQALSRSKYSETLLVLYGQYSSIHILDSSSLDTLCTLRSSCKPNWNIQITFLLNPEKKGG